ncbi:MAG: cation diffusion facilitator family transporter [Bacteroidales bacterium]|jgi:cation diffusion facilitator family transporter|nr:cation transporter [Bacteroidales bacterium]
MSSKRKDEIIKVTRLGFFVNLALTILKLFAGILGRSSAIIADAIHSLSDFITDIVVLIFIRISSKPQDEDHKYGHGKYETFASFVIGILLLFAGFGMFYYGSKLIYDVYHGSIIPRPGVIAIVAAVISVVSKEVLFWITLKVGKEQNSQAVIANAWHHRSDVFTSIATLIGVSGAYFLGDKYLILDPIAAIFVSIFIIKLAYDIVMPAFHELTELSLPSEVEDEIIEIINNVPLISNAHNLRTRQIGNSYSIEVHVYMPNELSVENSHYFVEMAEKRLKKRFGEETNISIHVEPLNRN